MRKICVNNLISAYLFVFLLSFSCDCKKSLGKFKKVSRLKNIIDLSVGKSTKDTGRGFFGPDIFTLGKVLNFFPVGGERECQPTLGYSVARSGICLNPYDCRQRDGRAAGDCAHGLGVCCVFEVSCGGLVQNNLTYFISPGFPEIWEGDGDCNITIEKSYAGIMQLKIDFIHFSIGQPNRLTGECDEDVMTIKSHDNKFSLCGQNHGQHIYYTLPTAIESREKGDLPGSKSTLLSIRRGKSEGSPRLWLIRLAQMPLAYSAPHGCLQYFTGNNGTITTFNFAINGRHLSDQDYKVCVRRNKGFCAVRYAPCDARSFRIGTDYGISQYSMGPGGSGGPGTGFYGPDGSFNPGGGSRPTASQSGINTQMGALNDPGTDQMQAGSQGSQGPQGSQDAPGSEGTQGDDTPQDGVQDDDMIEGSGNEPGGNSVGGVGTAGGAPVRVTPAPSLSSRIWRLIWPSWIWGQDARTWSYWSPYAQHYKKKESDQFLYKGYGNFGVTLNGYGRLRCRDRITIPCENEYLISDQFLNTPYQPGVCDPHHCGSSFCPGVSHDQCHVQSSQSPFEISVHFGPPQDKRSAEENIGACLRYRQLPCNS